jgi:hypothetical protein
MQDCSRSIGGLTKSGAGPRRWPSLALGAVSVIPIVLAIGGGAAEGQSESAIAPHSRAEVQQALRRQKPGVVIPQPLPRPPEAPLRPKRAAEPASDEEGGIEQRSHQTQPKQIDVDCQMRLTPDVAAVQGLPPISSGECAAEDVVRLDAVIARDGRRIMISPPATLRCPMAESIVHWVRDEVTSVAAKFGASMKSLMVDTSFECRSRNHVAGAKLSEHSRANAVDVRGFTLADGTDVVLTDAAVNKQARIHLRETACARFTTVLGPGSDGYHENHVHLDLLERRSGYRICQWDVRDPKVITAVPLPPERPGSAPSRYGSGSNPAARH